MKTTREKKLHTNTRTIQFIADFSSEKMEANGIGMTFNSWKKKKKKPTTKPRILYPGKLSFKTEYYPAISKKKQIIDTWNSLGKSAVN